MTIKALKSLLALVTITTILTACSGGSSGDSEDGGSGGTGGSNIKTNVTLNDMHGLWLPTSTNRYDAIYIDTDTLYISYTYYTPEIDCYYVADERKLTFTEGKLTVIDFSDPDNTDVYIPVKEAGVLTFYGAEEFGTTEDFSFEFIKEDAPIECYQER